MKRKKNKKRKDATPKDTIWKLLNCVFSRGVFSSFRAEISQVRVVGFFFSFLRMISAFTWRFFFFLTFMSRKKFMLSWVEHGKRFITSGPIYTQIDIDREQICHVLSFLKSCICNSLIIFFMKSGYVQMKHWPGVDLDCKMGWIILFAFVSEAYTCMMNNYFCL